jgi:hypothetical protein
MNNTGMSCALLGTGYRVLFKLYGQWEAEQKDFASVRILCIFPRQDRFMLNAMKGKSSSFSSHLRYYPSESK